MLSGDELGQKGESRFAELCADAKLVCNPSNRDRTGWDFVVEFPFVDSDIIIPLDKREIPISANVQVKTLSGLGNKVDITLSVAERLAKELRPAFICILKVGSDLSFTDAYLVHLSDDNLARVLKRLRSSQKNGKKKLNRQTISFHGEKDGKRIHPTGAALRAAIEECCSSSVQGYVKEKSKQISSLGYAAYPYTANLTFEVDDELDVVKALLGLKEISGAIHGHTETRFGIPLDVSHFPTGPAKFRIEPTVFHECNVVVRQASGGSIPANFSAKFTTVRLTKPDHFAIRAVTKFFEIVGFPSDRDPRFEFTLIDQSVRDFECNVLEWVNFARMLLVLSGANRTIEIVRSGLKTLSFDVSEFVLERTAQHESFVAATEGLRRALEVIAVPELDFKFGDINSNMIDLFLLNMVMSGQSGMNSLELKIPQIDDVPVLDPECLFARTLNLGHLQIAYCLKLNISTVKRDFDHLVKILGMELCELREVGRSEIEFEKFVEGCQVKSGIENVMQVHFDFP